LSLRVLVVDDSSAMRAFVRVAIEEATPAKISEAASGFDALRMLPREPFDVVIVDINMPDINGLEVAAFMRSGEVHRNTPLILMSTESAPRDRERGLALGADAFLCKPFTAEQLLEAIGALRSGAASLDDPRDEGAS